LSAKLIELKWSELKISQVFFFLLLSYMKWIMISFQFSFSLFREEFSKKVKIGQYWNVYLVYSIGWYDWDFKDENCLSSVKREWKRKFGFFKMGIWCGLLQVQMIRFGDSSAFWFLNVLKIPFFHSKLCFDLGCLLCALKLCLWSHLEMFLVFLNILLKVRTSSVFMKKIKIF